VLFVVHSISFVADDIPLEAECPLGSKLPSGCAASDFAAFRGQMPTWMTAAGPNSTLALRVAWEWPVQREGTHPFASQANRKDKRNLG